MTARPHRNRISLTTTVPSSIPSSAARCSRIGARYVGDTLTINIVENTPASTNSSSSVIVLRSLSASVPTITGLPGKNFQGLAASATTENDFAGKGRRSEERLYRHDHRYRH